MIRRLIIAGTWFVVCCSNVLFGQELNGQMGYDGPSQSTRINADADKSIIHVTSRIPNLRFDSNRGILKVVNLSSGDWDVLVSPGTHILKIDANNYERLVLPPFNFQKLKLYESRSGLQMDEKGEITSYNVRLRVGRCITQTSV